MSRKTAKLMTRLAGPLAVKRRSPRRPGARCGGLHHEETSTVTCMQDRASDSPMLCCDPVRSAVRKRDCKQLDSSGPWIKVVPPAEPFPAAVNSGEIGVRISQHRFPDKSRSNTVSQT